MAILGQKRGSLWRVADHPIHPSLGPVLEIIVGLANEQSWTRIFRDDVGQSSLHEGGLAGSDRRDEHNLFALWIGDGIERLALPRRILDLILWRKTVLDRDATTGPLCR